MRPGDSSAYDPTEKEEVPKLKLGENNPVNYLISTQIISTQMIYKGYIFKLCPKPIYNWGSLLERRWNVFKESFNKSICTLRWNLGQLVEQLNNLNDYMPFDNWLAAGDVTDITHPNNLLQRTR